MATKYKPMSPKDPLNAELECKKPLFRAWKKVAAGEEPQAVFLSIDGRDLVGSREFDQAIGNDGLLDIAKISDEKHERSWGEKLSSREAFMQYAVIVSQSKLGDGSSPYKLPEPIKLTSGIGATIDKIKKAEIQKALRALPKALKAA